MLLMFIALAILVVMVFFMPMPMLLMFITLLMHHMLIHMIMIMLMLMMLRAATLSLSLSLILLISLSLLLSLSLSLSVRVVLLQGCRHKLFPLRSSRHVFLLQLTNLYYARHALHVAHHTSLSHVFFQHLKPLNLLRLQQSPLLLLFVELLLTNC